MNLNDVLTITAILLSPVLAVQVSEFLRRRREAKERKVNIFKTLMSTRRSRLSLIHVQALNLIDTEFYNVKEVLDAWKTYLDHLYDYVTLNSSPGVWNAKQEDSFINLLYSMAKHLGYDFDKVYLKRASYSPEGHGKVEGELNFIREKLVELLSDKYSLTFKIKSDLPSDVLSNN